MKKIALVALILAMSVSVAACERKDAPKPKVVKTEKIVPAAPKADGALATVQSLDIRVTNLEQRNRQIDAAVRAKRAAAARVVK